MKKCKKCDTMKIFDCFSKNRSATDGLERYCKECDNLKKKIYYRKNRYKILEKSKKRYEKNKQNRKIYNKQYYSKNKQNRKIYNKQYYSKNTDKILERGRKYNKNNKEKVNLIRSEYRKKKKRIDLEFRMSCLLRERVSKAIKNQAGEKAYKSKELLGDSVEFIINYLFNNYFEKTGIRATINDISKKGLHIDHIIPCDAFDLTNPEEQKKCFHYTNLQLLSASENFKKTNKYIKGDSHVI